MGGVDPLTCVEEDTQVPLAFVFYWYLITHVVLKPHRAAELLPCGWLALLIAADGGSTALAPLGGLADLWMTAQGSTNLANRLAERDGDVDPYVQGVHCIVHELERLLGLAELLWVELRSLGPDVKTGRRTRGGRC